MPNLTWDLAWRDRGVESGLKRVGDSTERTHRRFSALKVTAAAALGAAAVGAVKFGGASVKAFVDAESKQLRLQDAYRKFPKLADTQIGALRRLNTELARKTRFDDDATASGQAVLAQFKLTGTQITQLTPLLQDYAAKTGKDLPTAARDLGKAVLGQGRSLKAVGINFKDTGSQAGNLEQITKGLRTQVGGFAEQEGKSAAGRAEILRNQFGELQEMAGEKLLPALLKIGGGLLKVVTAVQDGSGVFGSFKRIVSATFGAFSESVGLGRASFRGFADFIQTHQGAITTGFVAAGKIVIAFGHAFATVASAGLRSFAFIMDGQADMAENLVRGFRTILTAARISFGWIPGIGERLKEADAKFAAFSDTAAGGLRRAAAGARGAADGIDNKLRPALDKAGRKLDEVGRKEIVKAQTRDAVNKAAQAVRDLGTKTDGSQIKIKKFSDITKLSAAEQRAFRGRLLATRNALQAKLEKMRDAGAGSVKLRAEVNRSREALFREFRQMGLSIKEARTLATRYARVPRKIVTQVTQPGMKGALESTRELDRRIDNISNKTVRLTMRFNANATKAAVQFFKSVPGSQASGFVNSFRAKGGPIQNVSGRGARGRDTEIIGAAIDEHMWTDKEVHAVGGHGVMYRMRADALAGKFKGYAVGGPIVRRITIEGVHNAIPSTVNRFGPAGYAAASDLGGDAMRSLGRAGVKALNANLGVGLIGSPANVSNPRGIGHYGGGTFTRLFIAGLQQVAKAVGHSIHVTQGGFRPTTSYSGSTHNKDAIDTRVEYAVLRAFRKYVGAMGDRTGLGNWGAHMHGVPAPGRGYGSPSARSQYQDYLRRGGASQSPRSPWGLAGGAIVKGGRGGVLARIGEGSRDELVAPLPRNYERLVSAAGRRSGVAVASSPRPINLYVDLGDGVSQRVQGILDENDEFHASVGRMRR